MIIWLTGQPGAGKTTLADALQDMYLPWAFRIDGDDLRALTENQDYTRKGRLENIKTAQKIAHYLHNQKKTVIVSLVSPYKFQRETFKKKLNGDLIEIYIHTDSVRERDHYKLDNYEPPLVDFHLVDTTATTPMDSGREIWSAVRTFIGNGRD